eukprot:256115-Pelagomonas_calceolata.AAC.1
MPGYSSIIQQCWHTYLMLSRGHSVLNLVTRFSKVDVLWKPTPKPVIYQSWTPPPKNRIPLQKEWSEKTQWLVRYRISVIYLEENPAQGDVSGAYGGRKHERLGVKNGPEVELWAICG